MNIPAVITLACAVFIALVFMFLPWYNLTMYPPESDLINVAATGAQLVFLRFNAYTLFLFLVPLASIVATAAGAVALWRPAIWREMALVGVLAGVASLLYFIITLILALSQGISVGNLTQIGFWLAFIATVGLLIQIALPRQIPNPHTGQPETHYAINAEEAMHWIYQFILYPVGQMILFILVASAILTVLAYLLAFLFPEPRPNIFLLDQINKQLPDMIIKGVTIGFVYAMIALGYTLVYGVLQFINFAHSEIFMFGAVIGFEVMDRLNQSGHLAAWNPVLMVITVVLVAMFASGTLAVVIERVAYRPLRGAPRLVPLISAIGISFFLIDLVRAFEAITRNDFNLTYPMNRLDWAQVPAKIAFGETIVNIRPTQFIVVIGAVITLLILNYFVNGTKLGRGIRAVSQDMATAGLMGVNVNRMISLTFFVGGAFGGAAGALFGMNVGTVTPFVGFFPGIKAFTAAVLGGIGSVTGALLGGLTLGLIETFLNGVLVYFPLFGQRYTDIFAFSVLILILIFRPSGLLGERVDEKV
jgi:branched-chain amino acid transport system permease protein